MKKPSGFVAICQCGNMIGAMDYNRTTKKDAGVVIGKWLDRGCTVEPRFGKKWQVSLTSCECGS